MASCGTTLNLTLTFPDALAAAMQVRIVVMLCKTTQSIALFAANWCGVMRA
jgi:hypothetical protein